MTSNKLPKILVLASLVAAPLTASADPAALADDEVARCSALLAERADGTRVAHYAQLTTIAERDVATAQLTIDLAKRQWDIAVRDGDTDAASYWAGRQRTALADQREASQRVSRFRAERDRARSDFEASATQLRNPGSTTRSRGRPGTEPPVRNLSDRG